jgi:hypothetical protein
MEMYPIILLANEPGTYRNLLAEELPFLRPELRVVEVLPAELDEAVAYHQPVVVICSRRVETPPDLHIATLVLYPQGDDTFLQCIHGSETVIRQPRLSDILDAIDRVVSSSRA